MQSQSMIENMRLNEISNNVRREKKTIDKLFVDYAVNKTIKAHNELISKINNIYPTGYSGVDSSLNEYRDMLFDDLINKLKSL